MFRATSRALRLLPVSGQRPGTHFTCKRRPGCQPLSVSLVLFAPTLWKLFKDTFSVCFINADKLFLISGECFFSSANFFTAASLGSSRALEGVQVSLRACRRPLKVLKPLR